MNYTRRDRFIAPILEWAKANKEAEVLQLRLLKSGKSALKGEAVADKKFVIPDEFNGKDYITMLLHVDAEIEHGLMLQYLYAAYSIGNPDLPEKYQQKVATWKNIITGIAKEEMGHFISVQNVLKVIGAPLNFGRESYPWDIPFYPFPFALEKFSLNSLAKYVYAEAPQSWLDSNDPLAKEVTDLVKASTSDPHTVGALFKILLQLIQDPDVISDETFMANTYPYQAKFDEWGRGYVGGQRGSAGAGVYGKSPDVLVAPLMCRDDAYGALNEIAEQGEGEDVDTKTPSHFERFLFIFKEYKLFLKETNNTFDPSRNVATNPYISSESDADISSSTNEPALELESDAITKPETILWCKLFDIRYRLLLNFLNHSFALDNGLNQSGAYTPRGMVINSTFGEMYNLRSLATVIVQKPIAEGSSIMAGPPFTAPYTFDLPIGELNRWKTHKDLIIASGNIIEDLKKYKNQADLQFLNALHETDQQLLHSIENLQ
ncbi:ferritin-like protein [Fluviicola sp.]|uniref:ferritin-like domain-containing protein n=1 Tax=Fluviicola sp. TaxID=1917219 RepID=UPI00262563DE|nr:ferritin-like protein [Fluviicola sp.]